MMDSEAGFQTRRSWDGSLQPEDYFRKFASVQARGARAEKLAQVLDRTDRDRLILCTFTGKIEKGHHQTHEYTGDYDEAFQFWNGYEPPQEVKKSQSEVAQELRALAEGASSAAEHERLDYFARYVEFVVPYSESWSLAFHLNQILQQAQDLKKQGKSDEARQRVMTEGVPVWLKLAPLVREALLCYQNTVSERNELGALASMHNKYERLALFRLRASMKEFLGELPHETERIFEEVRKPDANAVPRIFIPTRPSLLGKGDKVRIFAVALGQGRIARVTLLTRSADSGTWDSIPMSLIGRRTYMADLGAHEAGEALRDYYVAAEFDTGNGTRVLTDPLEAPARFYTVTLG